MTSHLKWCPDCGYDRPTDDFGKASNNKSGLATYCREHHNARCRQSIARNGGARRYHMRRRYGIEPEEFDRLVIAQDGTCAICHVNEPTHLDHDHDNGRVRGALCVPCNNGLGLFRDRSGLLRRAAQYVDNAARDGALERHAV